MNEELLRQIFLGFGYAFILGICASRLFESLKVVFKFVREGKDIF